MTKKHQVRISSKRNRKGAGRKYRRQEAQDLRGMAAGTGNGFRPRRKSR